MKRKLSVITGPTSGIGREIAHEMGDLGSDLVLACRDIAKGEETAAEIRKGAKGNNIEVMHIDMSSQRSIREFSNLFHKKYSGLDILINNAAVSLGQLPRQNSVDGIEITFATNVMGYILLSLELLDLLKSGAPSRIVNVASHFASDVDLDDLQFIRRPFESVKAYAQSKACDRMLTCSLARRVKDSGVTANAMTPGLVTETGLYRNASPELMDRLRQMGGRTIKQGADTAVWLASSSDVEGISGKFFEQREEVPCEFRNFEAEEKLWSICESLTVNV